MRRFFPLSLLGCVLFAATSPFTVDDMLDVQNVQVADVSADGHSAAVTISTLRGRLGIDNSRFGDPSYIAPASADVWVINTKTGQRQSVIQKAQTRSLHFSPDGSKLALLVLENGEFAIKLWENGRLRAAKVPSGKVPDETADLAFAPTGELIVGLRDAGWRAKSHQAFEAETNAPIVVHSSKEPFLQWIGLRRLASDRTVVALDVNTGQARELAAPALRNQTRVTADGAYLVTFDDIEKKTDYENLGMSDSRVEARSTAADARPHVILASSKDAPITWSRNSRFYAYAKKDGSVWFGGVEDEKPRELIAKPKSDKNDGASKDEPKGKDSKKLTPGDDKDEAKAEDSKKLTPTAITPDGLALIATNKEGIWWISTQDPTQRTRIVKLDAEDKEAPRWTVLETTAHRVYLHYASRTEWSRGVSYWDPSTKKITDLLRDSKLHGVFRLAKNESTWIYATGVGNRPADLYAADADFSAPKLVLESNPQLKEKAFAKTQLVPYLDADGKKLRGVLYLPTNYEAGKKYPTIFILYEQFFDDTFNATTAILNANGYAVMNPSVELEQGFPGESWAKGVTAAANKLIEMGIADPDKLGVQGTSYGGYATNLLITQTNRFKAAINISGKVNMISFYTDSPRLGVRNTHAPEKSQDRIGATLWQQPQKYLAHSAILYTDRIKTPLLLMTGEQDHNVPARQAMEMYYAMRRLGKEVAWVQYTNGGHGMPTGNADEVRDYHKRILDWYDTHLKNPAKKDKKESSPVSGTEDRDR